MTNVLAGNPDVTERWSPVKNRQNATWQSGDYAVIGATLQIVGELLNEAANVRATDRVLDVAAGSGNATLAAARRSSRVIVATRRLVERRSSDRDLGFARSVGSAA